MGQILGIVFVYFIAYKISKSYYSISIAFFLLMFSIVPTINQELDSGKNISNLSDHVYNYFLITLIINLLVFSIFFYLVNKYKKAKLVTGEIIK